MYTNGFWKTGHKGHRGGTEITTSNIYTGNGQNLTFFPEVARSETDHISDKFPPSSQSFHEFLRGSIHPKLCQRVGHIQARMIMQPHHTYCFGSGDIVGKIVYENGFVGRNAEPLQRQ